MIDGKLHWAVDFDRTLAYYDMWRGPLHFGAPIPAMIRFVQEKLAKGEHVTVFSARIHGDEKTGVTAEQIIEGIGDWTEINVGVRLPATNVKLYTFDHIVDDIAIQVIPNTGRRVVLKKELAHPK